MTPQPLKRQAIVPRIDGIQRDLEKLRVLGTLAPDAFAAIERFLHAVRILLEHPDRHHLTLE